MKNGLSYINGQGQRKVTRKINLFTGNFSCCIICGLINKVCLISGFPNFG